ncbi:hypothetical protein ACMU_09790 [Actibacterium mucosum KCTC 23349]|uniref:HTH cro/C1-type domain-containing protein n=1 Tax=Actibacterium mucosum KCTC 23349 TaxID=1454373 RepID=A0A037ZK82_9RHOB|nr:helix-turn-helix transcriptional regulator [Actibacterium mucosum]KAJ56044.1 hypothetical protein ACMU_09790 [Actibacterium mucosum KCTC 23349]
MPQRALTGTRIRERRLARGVRQSDLARQVGVSPAYLNLIEHNRRRIGGKLLLDLADVLEVDVQALSEGAEGALIQTLREVAGVQGETTEELQQPEGFAGRFPAWAALMSEQHGRVRALERVVGVLSDRLAQDPFLSESLHEVLSTAASIRSTAAILSDDTLDPEWQARFRRNLGEDSTRLAGAAQSLIDHLDTSPADSAGQQLPQDEVETFLTDPAGMIAQLERAQIAQHAELVDTMVASPQLTSATAKTLAREMLLRFGQDAVALPFDVLQAAVERFGVDPGLLAAQTGADVAVVMRRLGVALTSPPRGPAGLVICDGSGTMVFRRALPGLEMPRFGGGCPLWPLYRALAQPGMPICDHVELPGQPVQRYVCFALCEVLPQGGFDQPPVRRSTMLILPPTPSDTVPSRPVAVGPSCRICPRETCAARREPSILAGGF